MPQPFFTEQLGLEVYSFIAIISFHIKHIWLRKALKSHKIYIKSTISLFSRRFIMSRRLRRLRKYFIPLFFFSRRLRGFTQIFILLSYYLPTTSLLPCVNILLRLLLWHPLGGLSCLHPTSRGLG